MNGIDYRVLLDHWLMREAMAHVGRQAAGQARCYAPSGHGRAVILSTVRLEEITNVVFFLTPQAVAGDLVSCHALRPMRR